MRENPANNQQLIAKWKAQLAPATLAKSDLSQGRAVFNLACAVCHTLYGEGGKIGPDLSGAGRDNLDYLLENIIDPSAMVPADFKVTVVSLKDGRVFNGVVMSQNARTLTLKIMNGTVTLEKGEIEETRPSELSLMPEGLLEAWPLDQIRDLIGYLQHPTQVEP
ncbi:MAG TPA: c-type cytochrome [Gemmatimonadales bacterium]|nr:c-type cytochrome [Gemmatimonadales bacterium]